VAAYLGDERVRAFVSWRAGHDKRPVDECGTHPRQVVRRAGDPLGDVSHAGLEAELVQLGPQSPAYTMIRAADGSWLIDQTQPYDGNPEHAAC
jgi:hypothetical protein